MLSAIRNNGSLVPVTGPANRLADIFDRVFNDDFYTPLATAPNWSAMPLSVWEDEHRVYVELDAPGMTEKDVELSLHQDALIIKGERRRERQGGGYDTRYYGRFQQRIDLPSPVDAGEAEAMLANGVLSVTIPKSEDAKPRRIALKSE
jgi:HSP20 family protein